MGPPQIYSPPSESASPSDTASPSPSQPNTESHKPSPHGPGSDSTTTQTAPSRFPLSPASPDNQLARLLPISAIDIPDHTNGRQDLDLNHAKQLANQIELFGLLHPITVEKHQDRYILVAGRHRLEAFRMLNKTLIPASITDTTEIDPGYIRLSENAHRSNLSPVEEAIQLDPLVNDHPGGVEGVATIIGRSMTWVLDRLEILQWPEHLLEPVHTRRISIAAAKKLAKIQPDVLRHQRITEAIHYGCSASTAQLWLNEANRDLDHQPPTSDFSGKIPSQQYTTQTKVTCYLCKENIALEHTRPMRTCFTCIEKIETMTQPQPTQHAQPTPHHVP